MSQPVQDLRHTINEGLRIQRSGPEAIDYIDVSNALADSVTKQNHAIFGRRGCGKTLLLQNAEKKVNESIRIVYINCEDYKQHSFPNVLIEIVDKLFAEMESHLTGWFGKKATSKKLIREIREEISALKENADEQVSKIKETTNTETSTSADIGAGAGGLKLGAKEVAAQKAAMEREYVLYDSKIQRLNLILPRLKDRVRDFFSVSSKVKTIFVELDDFYHLPRAVQPHIVDYVHRLCKDVPLFFKIATLKHASVLYADRKGQPTGAQERHDYQPINIDFTLADYQKTSTQVRKILYEYGSRAHMTARQIDELFMGEGFDRLVLAAGGVPRDFLSMLLEALSSKPAGQERIGKDDVRQLSLSVFQRRIEELKADSEERDQNALMRGIYAIRRFCTEKQTNVFLIADRILQEQNGVRELLNRLLDYRIVHSVGTALTHKSLPGTYNAYMIDIGSYANLRKLEGRFKEIDVTAKDAKEQCRNAPVLDEQTLQSLYNSAPADTEFVLKQELILEQENA
jgi:hypothetical protein